MEQRRRSSFVLGISLAALLAAAVPSLARAGDRPWRFADWNSLTTIDEVRIAPDGSRLVYAIGRVDARGEFADDFRILDLGTGAERRLVRGTLDPYRLRWSPDGKQIAVLADAKNGTQQIWLVSPGTGAVRALTESPRSVAAFAWSPKSDRIAAVEFGKSTQASAHDPFLLDPASDGVLVTRPALRTLWIVDGARGTQRQLVTDGFSYGSPLQVSDPSWSSDGATIAAVRQPTPFYGDYEREEYVTIDARTGGVRPFGERPPPALPGTAAPIFSRRGARIASIHTYDGTFAARSDVFVDGVDISAASDRDFWSCGGTQLAWSGDTLLATALDGVSYRLFALSPEDRSARPLTPASGSVVLLSVAADAPRMAYAFTTPNSLPQVYVANTDGSGARAVTHLRLPPDLSVPQTSVVTWTASGHELVGQLTLPTHATAASPLVVELHGGPQCADNSAMTHAALYFASNGYAFFRPSPRGSDGYGDWSYKAIRNDFGDGPMTDVLAGVDALVSRGLVDPKRLFVEGGSYGGYLTSWVVTHENPFRAAVAQFPVTDIGLDYELSESPNITKRFFGARPAAQNAEVMDRESPVRFAAGMNTPLLLITGMHDTRAPFPQTVAFYKTLVDYGKDARLLVYPDMGHGAGDPLGFADIYARTAGWFVEHGGPPLPGAIPSR